VEGNGFGLFEDTILTLTQKGLRKTIKTGQLAPSQVSNQGSPKQKAETLTI
jgi:hypothetical protein